MPSIVHYLDRVTPARCFDEIELARLDQVYIGACKELGIAEGDARRETIAWLVFQVADLSEDPANLTARVVALFSRPT